MDSLDNCENFKNHLQQQKEKGNDLFSEKHYQQALIEYCRALGLCQDIPISESDKIIFWLCGHIPNGGQIPNNSECQYLASIILSNIAETYRQLDQFQNSILSADLGLSLNPNYIKCYLQKVYALVCLYNISEASLILETCKDKCQTEIRLWQYWNLMNSKVTEISGHYQRPKTVARVFRGLDTIFTSSMDCAFLHQNIILRESTEKGRSFFAKNKIRKGELLMIDRGFLMSSQRPMTERFAFYNYIDASPYLHGKYMNLFPLEITEHFENRMPLRPIIEDKKREETLFLSGFKWKSLQPGDIEKLCFKFNFCCFRLHNEQDALFPHFSYFNHSCDPNLQYWSSEDQSELGKSIIVTAARDIQQDEELMISYCRLDQNFLQRRTNLWQSFAFQCTCERCNGNHDWLSRESELTGICCSSCGTYLNLTKEEEEVICLCRKTKIHLEDITKIEQKYASLFFETRAQPDSIPKLIELYEEMKKTLGKAKFLFRVVQDTLFERALEKKDYKTLQYVQEKQLEFFQEYPYPGYLNPISTQIPRLVQQLNLPYSNPLVASLIQIYELFGIRKEILQEIIKIASQTSKTKPFCLFS